MREKFFKKQTKRHKVKFKHRIKNEFQKCIFEGKIKMKTEITDISKEMGGK